MGTLTPKGGAWVQWGHIREEPGYNGDIREEPGYNGDIREEPGYSGGIYGRSLVSG